MVYILARLVSRGAGGAALSPMMTIGNLAGLAILTFIGFLNGLIFAYLDILNNRLAQS